MTIEKKNPKKKKEKPKYNLIQNAVYAFGNIWRSDKSLVVAIFMGIPVSFILSVIGLYFPKITLDRLEFSDTVQQVISAIIAILCAETGFKLINSYVQSKRRMSEHRVIQYYIILDSKKTLDMDYEYLEDPKINIMHSKAEEAHENNHTPAMHMPTSFADLILNILLFVLYGGVLSLLNPLILLILTATVSVNFFIQKYLREYNHKNKDLFASVNRKISYIDNLSENFSSAKDIRLYNMGTWLHNIGQLLLGEKRQLQRKSEYKHLAVEFINFIITFLRDGGAYVYLIYKAVAGDITAGEFVLYFAAIGQFAGWFTGLINTWSYIHTASLQFCDMRAFLELENKTNREEGIPLPETSSGISIELQNVTFQYPETKEPTIKNINLKIRAGEKIALVGLNGAGKTTLVKLMSGMYDPSEGKILVDGHEINAYNRIKYYSLFSAVFQKFSFLPFSIAQNISNAPPEETDMKKLEKCIQLSGLKEKLESLPNGAMTPLIKEINADGTELSGGEKQKVMLARAIYKDAPILILDEPTAALDPIAEHNMYMRYNEITKDKTSVFISHRLASTRFCDRIVLIENGEIAEIGTHDELLKKGGKYAELFEIQSRYYKENPDMSSGESEESNEKTKK